MNKIKVIGLNFYLFLANLPLRCKRLVIHFAWFRKSRPEQNKSFRNIQGFTDWISFIPFYLMDIIGIPEWVNILQELIFWNLRNLNPEELAIVYPIFKNSIPYERIRINENDALFAKRLRIAYANFNHINSYGKLSDRMLVHELVHSWQYNQFGSIYIYKALRAQNSRAGYNYGGLSQLKKAGQNGKGLLNFNFEQQGDIIEDYYLLNIGESPAWIDKNSDHIKHFDPIIKELSSYQNYPFKSALGDVDIYV